MLLPNGGITLKIRNLEAINRELGDQVLEPHETTYSRFISTTQLGKAVRMHNNQQIFILTSIPTSILNLLDGDGIIVAPGQEEPTEQLPVYSSNIRRIRENADVFEYSLDGVQWVPIRTVGNSENAITIQGKAVPSPTPADDEKVLAYDHDIDTFKYVSKGGDTSLLLSELESQEKRIYTLENKPMLVDTENAITIQGKPVPAPAATDDEKVLAYDHDTNSFKYVVAGGDTSLPIEKETSLYTAVGGEVTVPLGIIYDPITHYSTLEVYLNNIPMFEGINYTLSANNTSITFTNYQMEKDETVTFVVKRETVARPQETRSLIYFIGGTLMVESNAISYLLPVNMKLNSILLSVDESPTGADLIIDVHQNGTTFFANPANRPRIVDGQLSDEFVLNNLLVQKADKLTLEIDQVGSISPGTNLAVTITGVV